MREEIDSGRTELETAEHSDTSQRDLAEAPDETDATRKKMHDLRSEIVCLNNQLDSLRSSDSALQHQGGKAGSQLASKRKEVQQLHENLQDLRDKHKDKICLMKNTKLKAHRRISQWKHQKLVTSNKRERGLRKRQTIFMLISKPYLMK